MRTRIIIQQVHCIFESLRAFEGPMPLHCAELVGREDVVEGTRVPQAWSGTINCKVLKAVSPYGGE